MDPTKLSYDCTDSSYTSEELAVVKLASSLGSQSGIVPDDVKALVRKHFDEATTDWLVLSCAMMGWLNKVMDGLGVPLEIPTIQETLPVMGPRFAIGKNAPLEMKEFGSIALPPPPVDSKVGMFFSVTPLASGALKLEAEWMKGIPTQPAHLTKYLEGITGHDMHVVRRIRNERARTGIVMALRESLTPGTSVLGLKRKILISLCFPVTTGNDALLAEVLRMSACHGATAEEKEEGLRVAKGGDIKEKRADERALLMMARGLSYSPTRVDASVVEACRVGGITPAQIIEVVVWFGLLQMLHRLHRFYD
jgi:alkylhydroperoxidase family enzyme